MPLFGKKEKKSGTAENCVKKAAYPTQSMSAYPTQSCGTSAQPYQPAGVAPPPYHAVVQESYASSQPIVAPQNQQYMFVPQPSTVVVQGGFDAGARFDDVSRPNIPPPPPGSVLHPAQAAAYQGSNVVVTQKPGNFWTGGSDGGYTLF